MNGCWTLTKKVCHFPRLLPMESVAFHSYFRSGSPVAASISLPMNYFCSRMVCSQLRLTFLITICLSQTRFTSTCLTQPRTKFWQQIRLLRLRQSFLSRDSELGSTSSCQMPLATSYGSIPSTNSSFSVYLFWMPRLVVLEQPERSPAIFPQMLHTQKQSGYNAHSFTDTDQAKAYTVVLVYCPLTWRLTTVAKEVGTLIDFMQGTWPIQSDFVKLYCSYTLTVCSSTLHSFIVHTH